LMGRMTKSPVIVENGRREKEKVPSSDCCHEDK